MLPQHPVFGFGTASFKGAITPKLGDLAQVAHNSYISVLIEQGLVGLILFLTLLGAVFRSTLKLPRLERRFALVLLATLATAMLPLTWEDRRAVWVILAVLLGFSQTYRAVGRGAAASPEPTMARPREARAVRPAGRAPLSSRRAGRRLGMTPRVSMVTTVYNGAPYFDRAIPGILAQTYEDFEFVVVDDGSTDGTLVRLRALAESDRRFRVFAPGRLGAAAAYNFAVAQASGEYIARQDFDDRSYPERLRLQVAYLDAHPDVGIVGGAYLLVDERRGERYKRMPPTDHCGHHPRDGPIRPDRAHDGDVSPARLERGRGLSGGEQPDRSPVLPPGRQARMAIRQRARGVGRALRARLELVPPHAAVRRAPARPGQGAGAGGARAGPAALDVRVFGRALRVRLRAGLPEARARRGMARSREQDV